MSRLHGRVVRLEQAINHDGSLSEKEAEALLLAALRAAHRGVVVEDAPDGEGLTALLAGTRAGAFYEALDDAGRSRAEEEAP